MCRQTKCSFSWSSHASDTSVTAVESWLTDSNFPVHCLNTVRCPFAYVSYSSFRDVRSNWLSEVVKTSTSAPWELQEAPKLTVLRTTTAGYWGWLVDVRLLGCKAATLRRNTLPAYLALNMEAVCSSETLEFTYKSTRRYNPEAKYRHLYRLVNLKSHGQSLV
jgi:hypothetical protein